MENLIGKNSIFEKALCMKIMLFLYSNEIKINELFYALSCLELIDVNGNTAKTMQGLNPMLFIKNNLRNCLNLLEQYGLIYIENHNIFLTIDGTVLIDAINKNDELVKEYINKKNIMRTNYIENYYNLIDKRGALNEDL